MQSSGVVILTKNFHIETVQPSVPDTPPLVHPLISVISSGGGTFTVNGSGFLPSAPVHIRVVVPCTSERSELQHLLRCKRKGNGL